METTNITRSNQDTKAKTEPVDGCELNLSADKKWLRLIVSGKQVASFHVDYVRKILDSKDSSSETRPAPKERNFPASL